ncbi:nucleoside hydrolase isoform X2 [Patella vulgata]|nr:nucleoside hydrolase isoform X2 [Patella vulgata]
MKKIIIDVDTGVDDAVAIMFALSKQEVFDIVAITCVNGNVDITNVCRNTLRVLKTFDRLEIPVYKGAYKPFLPTSKTEHARHFHGKDGLGDVTWEGEIDTSLIQQEHAVQALIRLVNQSPGEITLVALAPLTNVALALQLDEKFGENLKEMLIMGGNIEGKGNVSLSAEFNFHVDPEAAEMVLQNVKCPVTLVSWETCIHSSLPWEFVHEIMTFKSTRAEFFKKIMTTERGLERMQKKMNWGFRSCDLFAILVLFDESVCVEFKEVNACVELQGRWTRGQMVVDWLGRWSEKPNVRIAMKLDIDKIKQYIIDLLK